MQRFFTLVLITNPGRMTKISLFFMSQHIIKYFELIRIKLLFKFVKEEVVNLKETLLSLVQQNVFIMHLKAHVEVDTLSQNVSIHFSKLFPVEKSLKNF